MTSGGLRTSVKGYLNAQRVTLPLEPVHHENDNYSVQEDSTSYGLSICEGSIPCLPMLTSTAKSRASTGTRIRAESLPHGVPSTPHTEGEILLKSFFFNELKKATRNFHRDNLLGEGSFGPVFKGWIDQKSLTAAKPGTGMVIAVKRLSPNGFHGHEEGFTEIYYLGQLRHPNLVRLIGYCSEDDELLLVYEFMPKGSLDNLLFGRASYLQPLSWILRMKIALGAAKVLAYLHSDEAKVIHRGIQCSNILLDSTYNVKLSDFGLAVDGRVFDEHPGAETCVMGTSGYAAPEYMATGRLTSKCDVFGFGVVMLEILSGKRRIDCRRPTGEYDLVEWAKPYVASKQRVLQILDARVKGNYSVARSLKAVELAFLCLSSDPKNRPNMNDVVKALEQLQEPGDMEDSGISQN
ncbi:hypothetical protein M0R45_037352 [Rubus argutus]|uniref:non-specific serine/threonine protein kinase n=1 Tax=Rubus argutus TaxID=59490 RepID=A0AAW1VYR9_RUBAR